MSSTEDDKSSRANHIDDELALEEFKDNLPPEIGTLINNLNNGTSNVIDFKEEDSLSLSEEIPYWPDFSKNP